MKSLTVIAPVFNEADVIEAFHAELRRVLDTLSDRYACDVLYVVDRSTDGTEEKLESIAAKDDSVRCLLLSTRFGHQMSLLAGIDHCDSDVVIMMDSDLQHPPEVLPAMLEQFEAGHDIVYTVRLADPKTGLVARLGGRAFYWLIEKLTPVPIHENAADFRLVSRRVVRIFQTEIRERNQFLRGLFAWVGFPTASVTFQCDPRRAGRSKYTVRRRAQFAANGIVSFSRRPLQLAFYVGLVTACASLLLALGTLISYFFGDEAPPGWTTLAILVPFLSGVQLIFLGVIGEYVGAIFDEIKGRPHYLVDRRINVADPRTPAAS